MSQWQLWADFRVEPGQWYNDAAGKPMFHNTSAWPVRVYVEALMPAIWDAYVPRHMAPAGAKPLASRPLSVQETAKRWVERAGGKWG